MPVKQRVAKERRPLFDAETLRLFLKLETTPPRRRRARWFQEAERDLHRRLGLGAEWLCSGTSATVLDGRDEPLYMDPDRPIYPTGRRFIACA